jgi:type VI secretion system protein ImpA
VRERSAGLFARTKDLRLAVLLSRALCRVEGLPGLALGLALIDALVERFWDDLHPRLDPEDNRDPTMRINALQDLGSRERLVEDLRAAPLVQSRVFGTLTYRVMEIAEGRASPPPGTKPLDRAAVEATFQDCDLEGLKASAEAAAAALGRLGLLTARLGERLPGDRLPAFEPLSALLSTIARPLSAHLALRLPAALPPQGPGPQADAAAPSAPSRAADPAEIDSREAVVRTIDRICDYYSRCEPSSPVPLLLLRARRLATGSFVDIVRDLAPGAVGEIERVCGPLEKG